MGFWPRGAQEGYRLVHNFQSQIQIPAHLGSVCAYTGKIKVSPSGMNSTRSSNVHVFQGRGLLAIRIQSANYQVLCNSSLVQVFL